MSVKGNRPIGVFDSGIGGLTVLKEIARLLPGEDTVYLGDTARVPYGAKSKETIVRYSLEIADFLIRRNNIKLLVVACNTASAYALQTLRKKIEVPVIGVIEPGARSAVSATARKRVGVIGTEGTIRSNAYKAAIRRIDPGIKTFAIACPMFVPLAEEGWTDDEVTYLAAKKYLQGLKRRDIDALVLGCTHYPLLKKTIARVTGRSVRLIDSATATAKEVKEELKNLNLLNARRGKTAKHIFFATDSPERFIKIGKRFFGHRLKGVRLVRLGA